MQELVEKLSQERMGLDAMFSSRGFKAFMEYLDDAVLGANINIDKITKGCIVQDRLSELNFNLGFKNGIIHVLNILEGMKEDLENESATTA